jgi:1-acyl-sn-glycerol-3-phosphate acyltransferase
MVYKLLRFIVRICLWIFFKKIYLSGDEHFHDDEPYFLACNHPMGFMEPLLLACFLKRDLHFLTRGDMFDNPIMKPLLVATNEIPIYRGKDGFSNLRNNVKTLEATTKALKNNSAIVIYIEGSTQMVKWLRPLQKGMARMSLRAMDQSKGLKPKVLPIGMSFTEPLKFRSEVIIRINKSIEVEDYYSLYKENKNEAFNQLTDETFAAMQKSMIDVHEDRLDAYESISQMWRTKKKLSFLPIVVKNDERFREEKALANKINILDEEKLKQLHYGADKWSQEASAIKSTYHPIWIIPAIVGYVFNWLPAKLATWFADTMVESMVFYSTIRMVSGLVTFLIYYISIIVVIIIVCWCYLWIPLAGVLFGISYLYHRHLVEEKRKEKIDKELSSQREELLQILN